MSNATLILIAVGLAMDAFAVSVGSGIAIRRMHIKHAMLIASFFGVFQAVMPLIGWLAGREAAAFVSSCDHWIAFGLLTFVGGKMIWEAVTAKEDDEAFDPLNMYVLFVLAIATSIDAFAVGVSLSFLDVTIMRPVFVIGGITFVMSFAGTYIGDMFGHLCEKKLLIVAGLVLIGMGVKILLT
jgi:putative Mn2+ efflux pump MntP